MKIIVTVTMTNSLDSGYNMQLMSGSFLHVCATISPPGPRRLRDTEVIISNDPYSLYPREGLSAIAYTSNSSDSYYPLPLVMN